MINQPELNKPAQTSSATSSKEDGAQAPALRSSETPSKPDTSDLRPSLFGPSESNVASASSGVLGASTPVSAATSMFGRFNDIWTDLFSRSPSESDRQSCDTQSQAASSPAQTRSSATSSDQANRPSTFPDQTATSNTGGGQTAPPSAPSGAFDDQSQRRLQVDGIETFPIGFGFGWSG